MALRICRKPRENETNKILQSKNPQLQRNGNKTEHRRLQQGKLKRWSKIEQGEHSRLP